MEQKTTNHPEGCMCMSCKASRMGGMCTCGQHGKHRLLRLALGIIILAMVLCLGIKIGEFHGDRERADGEYQHMRFNRYQPQMMYENQSDQTPQTTTGVSTVLPQGTTTIPKAK
jgi:hypothetical protein